MPYNYDFTKLDNIQTLDINPNGWINPLTIEYGIGNNQGILSYHWRVKGTQHTFVIPMARLNFICSGNNEKHFKEVLEKFREEYIEWNQYYSDTDWVKEYYNQYSTFILN